MIVDKQFAILPIHPRFFLGGFDDAINGLQASGCFAEDVVHFFERAIGGLGVTEVYHGYDECVDYGEDDVCLIADCGK